MYKTEAQKQASKVATMELSEACPHDIRKQVLSLFSSRLHNFT